MMRPSTGAVPVVPRAPLPLFQSSRTTRSVAISPPIDRIPFGTDGLNSASPQQHLAGSFVTPTDQFFIRSHAPAPQIAIEDWRLIVDGLVGTPLTLTFADLQRLPRREVTATLLCAGLRRVELLSVAPLPGELPWGVEPVGNARWTGVSLRDVLDAAGVRPDARHIEFTGLDAVERHGEVFGFGGSIDVEKARDPDVVLAWAQNGAPLTAEHGFPLRTVVPGWIGARSVKWLGRITAAAEPSANYFQTKAYRVQRTADPSRPTDVTAGVPLAAMTLNSAILDPQPGATVPAGRAVIRGWAIGAGGAAVTGVECSIDGGASWQSATVTPDQGRWSWRLWEATVEFAPGRHTLAVRAHDDTGEPQPAALRDVWNVKGYLNNAWHRVEIIAAPG